MSEQKIPLLGYPGEWLSDCGNCYLVTADNVVFGIIKRINNAEFFFYDSRQKPRYADCDCLLAAVALLHERYSEVTARGTMSDQKSPLLGYPGEEVLSNGSYYAIIAGSKVRFALITNWTGLTFHDSDGHPPYIYCDCLLSAVALLHERYSEWKRYE